MKNGWKKLLTQLSPILGAGAVGVCPLCWLGSASLLTYLGLGSLIPIWQGLVFVFLGLALIGFYLDYRSHKNIRPIVLLVVGATLLFIGRYVFVAANFGYWQIWGPGAVLILVAVVYNKKLFNKKKASI